jgi:hypothetical protein
MKTKKRVSLTINQYGSDYGQLQLTAFDVGSDAQLERDKTPGMKGHKQQK